MVRMRAREAPTGRVYLGRQTGLECVLNPQTPCKRCRVYLGRQILSSVQNRCAAHPLRAPVVAVSQLRCTAEATAAAPPRRQGVVVVVAAAAASLAVGRASGAEQQRTTPVHGAAVTGEGEKLLGEIKL